jgi:hypothetical protein
MIYCSCISESLSNGYHEQVFTQHCNLKCLNTIKICAAGKFTEPGERGSTFLRLRSPGESKQGVADSRERAKPDCMPDSTVLRDFKANKSVIRVLYGYDLSWVSCETVFLPFASSCLTSDLGADGATHSADFGRVEFCTVWGHHRPSKILTAVR